MAWLTWESHSHASRFVNEETLSTYTLEHNSQAWPAYNNLGYALYRAGHVPEAVEQFEQALKINPNYDEAHNNLGNARMQTDRVSEAIEQYEQALKIKPGYAEAHYNLGIALQKIGQTSEAIEQYEQALKNKPDDADAHNNLGIALHQVGRTSEAIEQFEQASKINPTYLEAHYNLGRALASAGRFPEAIVQFKAVLQIDPDLMQVQYALAQAEVSLQPLLQRNKPCNDPEVIPRERGKCTRGDSNSMDFSTRTSSVRVCHFATSAGRPRISHEVNLSLKFRCQAAGMGPGAFCGTIPIGNFARQPLLLLVVSAFFPSLSGRSNLKTLLRWTIGGCLAIFILLELWRPCYFLTDDNLDASFPVFTEMGRNMKAGHTPFVSEFLFGGGYNYLRDFSATQWHPFFLVSTLLADTPARFWMIDVMALLFLLVAAAGIAVLAHSLRRSFP